MAIIFVILIGTLVGIADSSTEATRFNLWWTIYLGIIGAIIASCIMVYGYFLSYFQFRVLIGVNFLSISVSLVGAFTFIYFSSLFSKSNSLKTT